MDQILLFLQPLFEAAAGKYGAFAQFLSLLVIIIGIVRAVIKPLRELAHVIVGLTKSDKDDQLLGKVEQSAFWKFAGFITDFVLSLKLPSRAALEADRVEPKK